MPWLFIDSAVPNEIRVGTLEPTKVSVRVIHGRVRALLVAIRRRYTAAELKKMDGICVVHGPGSFSAVRGGVLAANILSRLLGVPLVGVSRADAERLPQLAAELASGRLEPSSYVMPTYDAEPNITISCHP